MLLFIQSKIEEGVREYMKNREVIEKILHYHPAFPDNYAGCDNYKCGNPEDECTGVVTALVPTVEVIRKTAEQKSNLLIIHKPTFYSTLDYPSWNSDFPNRVYQEKRELLEKYRITIWRDHDHMHEHQPDLIFAGVIKYLEWECYVQPGSPAVYGIYRFLLPECTIAHLRDFLIERLHLNGMRYLGNPDAKISRVSIVGHLTPGLMVFDNKEINGERVEYGTLIIRELEEYADVIIPGEIVEWTVLSYVRDAIQLGKAKAVFNVGHFSLEELGMKYARDWISELVQNEIPVAYVPSGDMYSYK